MRDEKRRSRKGSPFYLASNVTPPRQFPAIGRCGRKLKQLNNFERGLLLSEDFPAN